MSQPKRANPDQQSFLNPNLLDQLNPKHPLLQLARQIDWSFFEDEFAPLYSHRGKPSKAIRLMVGLSILKHLEDLSDEVLIQRWYRIRTTRPLPERLNFNGSCPVIHADRFSLYQRMLAQKRGDKNKLYSLHEPHIYCMSKGKAPSAL